MFLRTIEEYVSNTIVIEKSRFICELYPVKNEIEAKEKINMTKKAHPKAVHHCYAYVIKDNIQNIENQSDDGEPSKTAGMPMLEILRYEKLVNILAIVTRYFGGTLLGTGGLIRAYSGSVKKAVDLSKIKEAVLMQGYRIDISYSNLDTVKYLFKNCNVNINEINYNEDVSLYIYVENDIVLNKLKDKVNNKVEIIKLDSVYL